MWAIERDHGLPLGKWGTHRDGLVVVFCLSSSVRLSVVVSVATTDNTTADYPGDKVPLPSATTGRPVRALAP